MASRPGVPSPGMVLAFGGLCGLSFLVSDSLVSALSSGPIRACFYVEALPFYAMLGLTAAVFAAAIDRLWQRKKRRSSRFLPQLTVTLAPVFLLSIQGLTLLNQLVLSGTSFRSSISVAFDLLWFALIVVLAYLTTVIYARTDRMKRAVIPLVLIGYTLASFALASTPKFIDRPLTFEVWPAAAHTCFLFAATSGFFLLIPTLFQAAAHLSDRPPVFIFGVTAIAGLVGAVIFWNAAPRSAFLMTEPDPPNTTTGPNVILIVVDTLRADHLSSYGYHRATSPRLDEFAADGKLITYCYSAANWTPPGHASIFTSKFPISHGAHKIKRGVKTDTPTCLPLAEEEDTIAEIMARNGYRTAAVIANFGFVSEPFGLIQGFQQVFNHPPRRLEPTVTLLATKLLDSPPPCLFTSEPFYRRAADITNESLSWIRRHPDRPFFLFINFMDPHTPYVPPSPWDDAFPGRLNGFSSLNSDIRKGHVQYSEEQLLHIRSQYDGEILYVDSHLGRFFGTLKKTGNYEDSLIIVTSDHGEFLGEKGLIDHQVGLYDPVIRVPLIVKPPRQATSQASPRDVAQTIDIVPTILDILDIQPPDGLQGTSIFASSRQPIVAQHYADDPVEGWFGGRFSDDQVAVVEDTKKAIFAGQTWREVYDLSSDPNELDNQVDRAPGQLESIDATLRRWFAEVDEKAVSEEDIPTLDSETREKLKSLGYIN